jgi:hypothetical protein
MPYVFMDLMFFFSLFFFFLLGGSALFFIIINVGVRVSLHAFQLIL